MPVSWQNVEAMDSELAANLALNLRELRQARGLTQQQVAQSASIPRATWALLESGAANPTLSVLAAAAAAIGVSLEELVAAPRASAKLYPRGSLPRRVRANVAVSSLLPDALPGTQIERLELAPGARLVGVPHTSGTREYLTCESGVIEVVASGEMYRVESGDVLVFRGDQRHSYANVGRGVAVGFSFVLLRPAMGQLQG